MALPTVFVCGVTGKQGSAVARHLTSKGAKVHSVSRDPSTAAAKSMEALGVQIWRGDWSDEDVVRRAVAGCDAVFLNQHPDMRDGGYEARVSKSIIGCAKDAGVRHLVYSGVLPWTDDNNPPPRHWNPDGMMAQVLGGKLAIEDATRTAGFPTWTILRPANFMPNYLQPDVQRTAWLADRGRWQLAVPGDAPLPFVDTDTIGRFACAAFLDPQRFSAAEITLVDELLTPEDVLKKLSKACGGRDLQGEYVPEEEIEAQMKANPFLLTQILLQNAGRMVDMDKIRSWGVPLTSFDAFLEREKDRVAETYAYLT